MTKEGDRLRNVETRESAGMIEVPGDPNTGAGTAGAPGMFAIRPTSGLLYYNSDGEPDGWVELGIATGGGEANTGTNIGTGAGVYAGKVTTVLQFRSLIGTAPIVATQNANDITFDLDINSLTTITTPTTGDELIIERAGTQYKIDFTTFASGSLNSVSNIGTGAGVYKQVVSGDVELRSLIGTAPVVATQNANDITFDLDVAGLTTITSPTTADYLIIERSGTQYKIDFTTFTGSGEANTGTNLGAGSQVYKGMSGTVLQFRSIIVSSPITIAQNADDLTFDFDITGQSDAPSSPPPAGDYFIGQATVGGAFYRVPFSDLGEVNLVESASSVGTGVGLYYALTVKTLQFRSIVGGEGIAASLSLAATDVDIDLDINAITTTGTPDTADYIAYHDVGVGIKKSTVSDLASVLGSGFITGATSLTTTNHVYEGEVSQVLRFRGLALADSSIPITITQGATALTFDFSIANTATAPGSPDSADILVVEKSSDGSHYKLPLSEFATVSPHGGDWIRTTDTALTTSSFYDIVWETENRDTDGIWSSGANLTIQTAGTYIIKLECAFASNATPYACQALIDYEGAYIASQKIQTAANEVLRIQSVGVQDCSIGDVIKGTARHTAGSNRNLIEAKIQIHKLSD